MKRYTPILLVLTILMCVVFQGCDDIQIFDRELSAQEIFKVASPSVVEITGTNKFGTSTGTGFFYDDKGTVITNFHVIAGCTHVTITLANGTCYDVNKVVGYNMEKDIVVLSTFCQNSTPLEIRYKDISTGEKVYTIGSSLGLSGSLSDGIVSTAKRELNNNVYIQTTAPISHGNSGGPLLDNRGRVIGITTAYIADGQNLNLAIPIGEIQNISTNNSISLDELYLLYVKFNPSEALGVTAEQYEIATMVSSDPISFCEHIYMLKTIVSNAEHKYDDQIDKAVSYLNNTSLERGQKMIIYKMIFMKEHEYNNDIVRYLNTRDDMTRDDKLDILAELGMYVDDDGYVWWD